MAGNPTAGDVHVNAPLTNISIAHMQAADAFVADRVFPNIPVQKQSDRYYKYDRADFWRNSFTVRAPSTESSGGGWKLDNTPTYYARVWGLHKDIDDQIRANADSVLDMDRDATLYLSQQAMIAREVTWIAAYFTTGLWTGVDGTVGDVMGMASSIAGNDVVQWDQTSATPIQDVKLNADKSQQLTGFRPNKLVLGRQVWSKVSEGSQFVDRIKYSGGVSPAVPAKISLQAAAALWEVDEVLVAQGVYATSAENPAFETAKTTAFLAGKHALLVYSAPAPSLLQPSGGYTFSWTGYTGAGGMGQRIKKFRMEWLSSDRVEAEMSYDQKLVSSDCGVFFSGIVA